MSDVEALMKLDGVSEAAKARCGVRFVAWYSDLRKHWK